jgi:hypothetical protein
MSLDRLLGSWRISMQHVAMPEPVAGHHRYERVLDGAFVMSHSTYDHPDFPNAVSVLDEGRCSYFDVRGVTRIFDLEVNESGFSMIRRDNDFWQRSQLDFVTPDAIQGTGENSLDSGASWQHDYSISFTRSRVIRQ